MKFAKKLNCLTENFALKIVQMGAFIGIHTTARMMADNGVTTTAHIIIRANVMAALVLETNERMYRLLNVKRRYFMHGEI